MCENSIFLVPVKHTLVCCTRQLSLFPWLQDTQCVLITNLAYKQEDLRINCPLLTANEKTAKLSSLCDVYICETL